MENRTVILANGDFPKKGGAAWKLLAAATRVVCCDGGADAYRRHFRKWPDAIVGDFDSIREKLVDGRWIVGSSRSTGKLSSAGCHFPDMIRFTDQDTNDLEKAIVYCAMRRWKNPLVVGATGRREDHTIGNIFRALDYGVEIVTDRGRFVPVCGKVTLRVRPGAAVSVFAPDPKTRMTSKGLEWPLDGVKFRNLYCATLNRTTAATVALTATRPVCVYLEF